LPPSLRGCEKEPVAYIRYFLCPAAIHLGLPLPAAEPFDDAFYLKELAFRILFVSGSGQRTFGTGTQFCVEITNVGVRGGLSVEDDIPAWIVVDPRERLVDARYPFPDRLSFARKLALKICHFANRILVEQFFEAAFETRQTVRLEPREHFPEL